MTALVHGHPEDAVDILTSEHDQIRKLIRDFEMGGDKEAIAGELFNLLPLHLSLEDTLLYPLLHGPGKFDDEIPARGKDEHTGIHKMMNELKGTDPETERFRERFGSFAEKLAGHFGNEETNIFPLARERLGIALQKVAEDMRLQQEVYLKR